MIRLTLESQPPNAAHWSTPVMHGGWLRQTMVPGVWRAFGLHLHRAETFKLSTNPAFIDKVRNVVGFYLAPPHRAVVLCVDDGRRAALRSAPQNR